MAVHGSESEATSPAEELAHSQLSKLASITLDVTWLHSGNLS